MSRFECWIAWMLAVEQQSGGRFLVRDSYVDSLCWQRDVGRGIEGWLWTETGAVWCGADTKQ